MLSRHPELARKMKANSAGERVLDEEAIAQKGFDVRRQAVQMAEFYRTGQNPPGHTTE